MVDEMLPEYASCCFLEGSWEGGYEKSPFFVHGAIWSYPQISKAHLSITDGKLHTPVSLVYHSLNHASSDQKVLVGWVMYGITQLYRD